jgi:hypothetical protein
VALQYAKLVENNSDPSFGSDPELFLARNGHIVPSSELIPEAGMKLKGLGKIVRDGIQLEINPQAAFCRAEIGNMMADIMRRLQHKLEDTDLTVCWTPVIRIPKRDMDAMPDRVKMLGCNPSKSIYKRQVGVRVNPFTYRTRSAGGHLHFGNINELLHEEDGYERFVALCDIVIGNTAVLFDRHPLMRTRRRVYGRAGEFREQPFGVEYRTLSNTWLRAYPLMSFVMGLGRLVSDIMGEKRWEAEKTLRGMVPLPRVRRAINLNDVGLAKANFEKFSQFLEAHVGGNTDRGLSAGHELKQFQKFVAKIDTDGLEAWFPDDPMKHWTTLPEGHECGWENFLQKTVARS